MDYEIPIQEQKRQRTYSFLRWLLIVLALLALVVLVRYLIRPAADYRALRTDLVRKGSITASLSAIGTVVPEFEQIISSPISARIDSVFFTAGSQVESGTPILKLDLSTAQAELNRLEELIQKKRNEAEILRLRLEKNLAELQASYDIKELRIQSLQSALASEKRLVEAGGGTLQDVEQAELNLQIARRELQQLAEQIANQRQTNAADLTALRYDLRIEENNRKELETRMQQAQIKASRKGVLVYVKDKLGATVAPGEELVRLADLSRFKVEARISDVYGAMLQPGGAVRVRINDKDLPGTISAIQPEVRNNQISFELSLANAAAAGLRPNLQVEVQVVTAAKDGALIVKNGPFYKGRNSQKVFVVQGDKAYARSIDLGLSNLDSVEVLGLEEGEELIISDMSEYSSADMIHLQNIDADE